MTANKMNLISPPSFRPNVDPAAPACPWVNRVFCTGDTKSIPLFNPSNYLHTNPAASAQKYNTSRRFTISNVQKKYRNFLRRKTRWCWCSFNLWLISMYILLMWYRYHPLCPFTAHAIQQWHSSVAQISRLNLFTLVPPRCPLWTY